VIDRIRREERRELGDVSPLDRGAEIEDHLLRIHVSTSYDDSVAFASLPDRCSAARGAPTVNVWPAVVTFRPLVRHVTPRATRETSS
jgi:hypothetical protein